jgi:hypothetical protein
MKSVEQGHRGVPLTRGRSLLTVGLQHHRNPAGNLLHELPNGLVFNATTPKHLAAKYYFPFRT